MREFAEEGRCADDNVDTIDTYETGYVMNIKEQQRNLKTYQSPQLSAHRPYDTGYVSGS